MISSTRFDNVMRALSCVSASHHLIAARTSAARPTRRVTLIRWRNCLGGSRMLANTREYSRSFASLRECQAIFDLCSIEAHCGVARS
jgi:hypothetical protein